MTNQFDYLQEAGGSAADDDGELDITPLVEPVATFLIVIGIIMLIIAVLGVVGACCDLRIILIVVTVLQLLLDYLNQLEQKHSESANLRQGSL